MGFGRGFLPELINLLGIVGATVAAAVFHRLIAQWISPWWRSDPPTLDLACFLVILLVLTVLVRVVTKKLAEAVTGKHLHWTIQGIGIALGGVRGLWWSGLVVSLLLALGDPYFKASVSERSVLAPHLEPVFADALDRVVSWLPNPPSRKALIPQVNFKLPSLPKLDDVGAPARPQQGRSRR